VRFEDQELQHLLTWVQDGVVSRAQILAFGGTDADIKRMLRRRELVRLHAGVFLNHTGRPTWHQSAYAAVLACGRAALGFESALGIPTPDGRIRVVVPTGRKVVQVPGVRVQSIVRFDERVDSIKTPAEVRFAGAAIDVAAERGEADAFGVLTDALWTRRTNVDELRGVLASRPWQPRRSMVAALLEDIAEGTNSVLERGYLHHVERPHGLPRMNRQARDVLGGRTVYRDGEYAAYRLVIELDGVAHHSGARARAADSVRDLETLASRDEVTVRLTYAQVFDDPCRSAELIGQILARRGWPGRVRRCSRCGGSRVS